MLKCIVCGDNNTSLLYKDMSGYMKGTFFDIYHCNYCGSNFIDENKIDYKIYDKIYQNEDKIPGYQRYSRYYKEIKNKDNKLEYLCKEEYIPLILKHYLKGLKNSDDVSILEVGCGLGYTTYALNEEGYRCLGMDISENSIKKAKKKFGDYYFVGDANRLGEHKEWKHKFDIVYSTEVIEHISNISLFIDNIRKFLKPGGALILTTPNKDYMPKGCIWTSDVPPVHTCLIGSQFFRKYSQNNDLELLIYNYNIHRLDKNVLAEMFFEKKWMKHNHEDFLKKDRIDFDNLVPLNHNTSSGKIKSMIYNFIMKNKVCILIGNIIIRMFLFWTTSKTLGIILKDNKH